MCIINAVVVTNHPNKCPKQAKHHRPINQVRLTNKTSGRAVSVESQIFSANDLTIPTVQDSDCGSSHTPCRGANQIVL